jgi:hypothetical protein
MSYGVGSPDRVTFSASDIKSAVADSVVSSKNVANNQALYHATPVSSIPSAKPGSTSNYQNAILDNMSAPPADGSALSAKIAKVIGGGVPSSGASPAVDYTDPAGDIFNKSNSAQNMPPIPAPSLDASSIVKDSIPVPYGDLAAAKKRVGSAAMEKSVDIDQVVMLVNRKSTKSNIKMVDFRTNEISSFPYFIMNQMSIDIEQKYQMFDTFDASFIYMFGAKPMTAQFIMSCYDIENASWWRSFYKLYQDTLAGFKAASKKIITYILTDDWLFEGVIVKINPQKDAISSTGMVRFSLFMILTGVQDLSDQSKLKGPQAQDRQATDAEKNRADAVEMSQAVASATGVSASSASFMGNAASGLSSFGSATGLNNILPDIGLGKLNDPKVQSVIKSQLVKPAPITPYGPVMSTYAVERDKRGSVASVANKAMAETVGLNSYTTKESATSGFLADFPYLSNTWKNKSKGTIEP